MGWDFRLEAAPLGGSLADIEAVGG